MNRLDLITIFKKETGLTQSEAESVVNLFFAEMTDALAKGRSIEIRGFCSFYVKQYNAYTGRNPKTGETTKVRPKKLPFFKCGKALKQRVDK